MRTPACRLSRILCTPRETSELKVNKKRWRSSIVRWVAIFGVWQLSHNQMGGDLRIATPSPSFRAQREICFSRDPRSDVRNPTQSLRWVAIFGVWQLSHNQMGGDLRIATPITTPGHFERIPHPPFRAPTPVISSAARNLLSRYPQSDVRSPIQSRGLIAFPGFRPFAFSLPLTPHTQNHALRQTQSTPDVPV